MAFVPIPDGVRIVHLSTCNGSEIVETFGAQNANRSTQDLLDMANRHGAAYRAHLLPLKGLGFTHTMTLAYDLGAEDGGVASAELTGTGASTAPANPHPLNVAAVIALKTAKRGRTYQGRCFLGALSQSLSIENSRQWAASARTTIQSAIDAYKAQADPPESITGGRLAIVSKGSKAWHESGGTSGIAPHAEPVTACIARSTLGTQRRRLVG